MIESELHERWQTTWDRLGAAPPGGAFERLFEAYSGAARHYHDVRHLRDTFAWLDQVAIHEQVSVELELALWFHDVVYDTRAKDNEAQSAAWAERELRAAATQVTGAVITRVSELILATNHSSQRPKDSQTALLLDVDLSILGASPQRFREYESEIRREYAWVPALAYRAGRKRVLDAFSRRSAIYLTPIFAQRLESQARLNLEWAKSQLSSGILNDLVERVGAAFRREPNQR